SVCHLRPPSCHLAIFFFLNATSTTLIYTLSLHDALPISPGSLSVQARLAKNGRVIRARRSSATRPRCPSKLAAGRSVRWAGEALPGLRSAGRRLPPFERDKRARR